MSGPQSGVLTYQIFPYKENELGVNHRESLMKHLSTLKEPVFFGLTGNKQQVKLLIQIPFAYKTYFENLFYATFSSSELILQDSFAQPTKMEYIYFAPKTQIQTKSDFTKDGSYLDPLRDVLSLFESVDRNSELVLWYEMHMLLHKGRREGFWEFFQEGRKSLRVTPPKPGSEEAKKENEESLEPTEVYVKMGYHLRSQLPGEDVQVKLHLQSVFAAFVKKGNVKIEKKADFKGMSYAQWINFFHMPTKTNQTKNLDYIVYKKLPFPPDVPTIENSEKNKITLIGTTDYKGEYSKFGIRAEDKFRHMYIVGKTGTGKSTFISNMVKSDMVTNNGLCLIDPHGDLIETVLEHVPTYRINDVILFDVADQEYPIGFNLLQYENENQKNLIVSGVVSTFEKLYGNSWGPRLEYILRFVMLAIVEYPNSTLMHITRILVDKNFREEVLSHVTDNVVLKFRREEFDKWTDKFRDEAIAPVLNKVGQFLSSKLVRNIFGQPDSKLNVRKAMDEGKILLVNLSKGKIGEDNANMIGSFLVTKLQIDAMSRSDMAFKDRKDFFLYIDEFQNFATRSFSVIFSEARKYKLSLIVANQYTSQLDLAIKDSIFGNVGTIISFTLGHDDAMIMSSQFKGMIDPNDFISLPKFKGYIKLMVDGITSDPFSMQTMPLPTPETSEELREKILTQSRQRYGIPKEKLEGLLNAWSAKTFSPQEKIMEKAKEEGRNLNVAQSVSHSPVVSSQVIESSLGEFTIDQIQLGNTYEGYVKLLYNYGIFVTVFGVEGLLHKNFIVAPEGVDRKKYYRIGDKISVKASEFKDINGQKRVVRVQK